MTVNNVLPIVGDRIKVDGISCDVKVIKLVPTDIFDGKGDTVFTIHIAGFTNMETGLLQDRWISSLGPHFEVVNKNVGRRR